VRCGRPALDPNPRQSRDEHGYVSVAIGLVDSGRSRPRRSARGPSGAAPYAKDLPGGVVLDAVAARHPDRDRDAALRAEAWRNLRTYPREAPAAYAAMVAKKLPRLWLKPSPRSDGLRATPLRIWHALIVLAAFAGLLLAFTLFHLVVEAIPRYALPALPVLIAAGTAGWFSWLAARRAPRTRPATPDWPVSPAPPPARPASPSRSA
jgi:hypothetical protein